MECQQWETLFHLPLSQQAHHELLQLHQMVQSMQLQAAEPDCCVLKQNGKQYVAKSYYTYVHRNIIPNTLLKWIWASSCTMKIKVFSWMMIMDRLNTQDMLLQRHWNVSDSPACVLFSGNNREDRDHLFFNCRFSHRIWNFLQIYWPLGDDQVETVMRARAEFAKPFFTEVVFIACWKIWTIRNGKVFKNERPSFNRWRSNFIHDITLMTHRIKPKFRHELFRWIAFLPP